MIFETQYELYKRCLEYAGYWEIVVGNDKSEEWFQFKRDLFLLQYCIRYEDRGITPACTPYFMQFTNQDFIMFPDYDKSVYYRVLWTRQVYKQINVTQYEVGCD
jgi:hypothetical protein